MGQFPSKEAAREFLDRLRANPSALENRAPCTSWRTCSRQYYLLEYDTASDGQALPASVLRRSRRLLWVNEGRTRGHTGACELPPSCSLLPLRPAPTHDRDTDRSKSWRRPAPRRGAGAAPPAWGAGAPDRSATLAAQRSPTADRNQSYSALASLAIIAAQLVTLSPRALRPAGAWKRQSN
jgi:hypothetical protein